MVDTVRAQGHGGGLRAGAISVESISRVRTMVRSAIHLHLEMPAESTIADLTSPLAHVRILPDVRFDKVLATRDALQGIFSLDVDGSGLGS